MPYCKMGRSLQPTSTVCSISRQAHNVELTRNTQDTPASKKTFSTQTHIYDLLSLIKDRGYQNYLYGSIALLSHFHKVLTLSKFALLKCEIEVTP